MRTVYGAILVLGIFLAATPAWSKAGPPIPVPKIEAGEAIKLARDYFLHKEDRVVDRGNFKKSEYILISVEYTRRFGGKRCKAWAWKVRFVHPVANDHSVEYKVTGDRKVVFLGASE